MRDRLRMEDHGTCSLFVDDWTSVPFIRCGLLTCQRHGSPESGHFGGQVRLCGSDEVGRVVRMEMGMGMARLRKDWYFTN